ncbi:MAG: hypothetical protein EON58_02220 [Alphaproteobacteria bacterium]|nr:MAG: hypothetical protein EON58_02220 [Alphaproteobacteria bacterium]
MDDTTNSQNTGEKDPNRDESGRFVDGNSVGRQWGPGESGNPNGSSGPKIKVSHFLNKYGHLPMSELKRMVKDLSLSAAEMIAVKQLLIAAEGSLPHAQEVVNRTEGTLNQKVTFEGAIIKDLSGVDMDLV